MVQSTELRLIDDELSRQLSFAKRRNGLIKKALELFMVLGVDCVFISFSPSGRLSYFCGDKRVEEVIARFAELPDHVRRHQLSDNQLQELSGILNVLKAETEEQFRHVPRVGTLRSEILRLGAQRQTVLSELSNTYQPFLQQVMTAENVNISEGALEGSLAKVQDRMKQLVENDPTQQPSSSRLGAGKSPAFPSDETHQAEHENSDRNQDRMLLHSPAGDSIQATFTEKSPPKNLFLEMGTPRPQHAAGPSYSSLLMSTENLTPLRTSAMPLGLKNSRVSLQRSQYSPVLQESLLNNQIYPNGHAPEGIQSSDQYGSGYGTPYGYNFPTSNLPTTNFEHPSSLPGYQAPHPGPFQLQSSNAAAHSLSSYYQASPQMSLGGSSSAVPYNGPQWPNQGTFQSNVPLSGQRGGFQNLLSQVSGTNNMYHQDAGSSGSFIRPTNLQMNHQQGLQGNRMPATQGHVEAVGSSSNPHKRKLPWDEDDIALRLHNNQNMRTAQDNAPQPQRAIPNGVYDPKYERMGLAIDPHLRIFEELTKFERNASNRHQANQ